MNKNLILGLGALAGIYLVYKNGSLTSFLKGKQNASAPANSMGAKGNLSEGSQPWYNQATNFLKSEANKQVASVQKDPTAALKSVGSVVHSLGDITGITSWFQTDYSQTTIGVDDPGWDSNDVIMEAGWHDVNDLPASDVDQSDKIGSIMADWSGSSENISPDPGFFPSSDDGYGGIGDSNSDFSAA